MSLIGVGVRADGGVGVHQSQHLLEDGGPSAVLGIAGDGHTEDLVLLLLEGVVAVITDDVTLTFIV